MQLEAPTPQVVEWILHELRALRAAYDFDIGGAVPRDLVAVRPEGAANSILWLVWHLARIEDVAINTIIRDAPQVLFEDGWTARIGTPDTRVGTGFADADVRSVTEALDIDHLHAYWAAVRARTLAWLESGPDLEHAPDVGARLSRIPEIAPPDGAWLAEQWAGKPARYFVRTAVIAHGYVHLGEMRAVRGRLGIDGL